MQVGWGKRPEYVLAAAATGVTDVTRRYTASFAEALARRTLCAEASLVRACALVTARLRAALPADRRAELIARDSAEEAELARSQASGAGRAQLAGLPGAGAARLPSFAGECLGASSAQHHARWRSTASGLLKVKTPCPCSRPAKSASACTD